MLQRKDVRPETVLIDDISTGKRAAMVLKGKVVFWDALFPKKLIEQAAGPVDWGGVGKQYSPTVFGSED